jgi:hypothetical protein
MFELAPKPLWWLPTLGFFFFVAIEFASFLYPDSMFTDPGVGRHLRTAEAILATHRVQRTDPLSFTHAGEPWYDYEWGFEATIGELNRVGGLGLVCAFATALFAATILGVYRMLLQTGASLTVLVIVTGFVFLTLHMHFSCRPLLFTYLFMALVVEVWRRHTVPRRRDWILLPLIFFAWANIHAGWAAALVFLSISIAGRFIDRFRHRLNGEDAPLIPWLGLLALCAFATSFNPWGWQLHHEVFLFATAYKSFALWNEYNEPDFAGPSMSGITVLFLLIVIIVSRAFRRAPVWRWEILLPVLFFLYEGLKAQRHVLLLMIVIAVPIAQDLEVLLHATWLPYIRDRLRQFQERQRLAGADAWLALLVALGLGLLYARTPIAARIHVGDAVTPQLVSFIRDHPDRFRRPLVTTWNAGPLLWNLRPDFRVSFDDRGDFYGDDTVFAFVDLYNGAPGWRKTFDREHFDSAILDRYLALNQILALRLDWKVVYSDKKTIVYWHARSPAETPAPSPDLPPEKTHL